MRNIYKRIENPLSREDAIDKLIEAYCDNYNLYDGLTKSSSKDKVHSRYSVNDTNRFYLMIYNDWKDTIHKIREANYLEEPHKSRISKLDNYLQRTNPNSYEEVMDIVDGKKTTDEDLKRLINDFRWNRVGEYSSWKHIDSEYIKVGLHKRQEVEHRLYINCDSTKTHLIARKFIEKCKAIKSKYYFKYDPYGDRDDTIVIYSDTKHLPYYIDMLNEIIRENHLESSIHNPPLVTGKIGEYIGYGSEPFEENGVPQSFNSKREEHLEACIKLENGLFIQENLSRKIVRRGEQLTYRDILIDDIIRVTRERTLKYMKDDENESKKERGYSKKEVQSSFFDITLRDVLNDNLDTIIENYKRNKRGNCIQVKFGTGIIMISGPIYEEVFKHQMKLIFKKSKKYKERLKAKILETAHIFDIDKDNYAVDLSKCAMLGKGEEDGYNPPCREDNSRQEKENEKPKSKIKRMTYTPMTDEEIEESRRKLGM